MTIPNRLVDAQYYGWWVVGGVDGGIAGYVCSRGDSRVGPMSYDDVAAQFGPLAPVVPAPAADVEALRTSLRAAGRKAVTTLLAALGKVWESRLPEQNEGGGFAGIDYDIAMRALTAGRPGSWEATCLREGVYFGRDLLHEKPRRLDTGVLEDVTAVLTRWAGGPERVELAETLASIVSGLADEHGSDGWAKVADQWLQPGGMAKGDIYNTYRWLYSLSEHHNINAVAAY